MSLNGLRHIYDYFLSTAATSSGQQFRRRQQRLTEYQQYVYQIKGCVLKNLYNLLREKL